MAEIDFISRLNGYGEMYSAQTSNLRGINHARTGTSSPSNQDSYGFTFFTRPRLNLSYNNLTASRIMRALRSRDNLSMANAIRVLLDPVSSKDIEDPRDNSSLVDTNNPFIPVLTNNLLTMSGWPDITVDTYTSKPGIYREAYSMVDGTAEIFNTFDITANFKNVQGDPITLLFTAWVHYASMVYTGKMVPYPDAVIENEIDYNTRIYRFVMDKDHRYIQKMAATGAAFPMASPLGSVFNFSAENKYSQENEQISIPFRCIGANYLDTVLIREFNGLVSEFKLSMSDGNRSFDMVKIDRDMVSGGIKVGNVIFNYLNHRAYPRINPTTLELEWWVPRHTFENALSTLESTGVIPRISRNDSDFF